MVDDLTGPQIASFLDEHVREMLSITPPESKHALDLETLRGPGITFWSVMDGGTVVGCGALKRLDARHAEVKSMRTLAARKRSGIASMMLQHIITEARRMGFTRLSLETGSDEFFAPARRLYEKYGFRPVGLRPRYYSDDNEDALIMTTDALASSGMRERLVARLARAGLDEARLAEARRDPATSTVSRPSLRSSSG